MEQRSNNSFSNNSDGAYQSQRIETMDKNSISPKFLQTLQMLKTKSVQIGKIIALDCEMVGVGQYGLDSALARVSMVDINEIVIFDTYVQVSQPVIDYRTHVSGITKANLAPDKAMTFHECRSIVYALLSGRVLVGHAIDNDLRVIDIQHPLHNIRDTATYLPFMRVDMASRDKYGSAMQRRKLRDLVREKLGDEIQRAGQAHSSAEDACAALKLYKSVRKEWETLLNWQKQKSGMPKSAHPSQIRHSSKSTSPKRTSRQRHYTQHNKTMRTFTNQPINTPQRAQYAALSA